jgi:hypothetical protein
MRRATSVLALALVAGCAAPEKPRPAEVEVTAAKTRIFLPGFLVLEKRDLELLKVGIAARRAKNLQLGGGRTAECGARVCTVVDGKTSRVPVTARDVTTFLNLQKAAGATGKETTRVEAPVTVRCTPEKCTADLLIETTGETKLQGKTRVEAEPELDVAGSLLQGFVKGLIGN